MKPIEIAVVVVIILILAALLMPATQMGTSGGLRDRTRDNLKQLGLGLHNYHDTSGSLPPAIFLNEQEEPGHSWMTMLLPHIEQGPLFDQIDLSVPWDSEKNRKPLETRVSAYRSPAVDHSEVKTSGNGMSHFAGNVHVIRDGEPLKFKDITDGKSATIMMGESFGKFEPWGKPGNVRDPVDGINKSNEGYGTHCTYLEQGWVSLERVRVPGCNFGLADGSVRWISEDIDPDVLRRLALPNDGEDVGEF